MVFEIKIKMNSKLEIKQGNIPFQSPLKIIYTRQTHIATVPLNGWKAVTVCSFLVFF